MFNMGLVRSLACLVGAGLSLAAADTAGALYRKAKKAEKEGDATRAYLWYAQAAAADPNDVRKAWARGLALRTRALIETNALPPGLEKDAGPAAALSGVITPAELEEARRPLPPLEVQGNDELHSFDLSGNARELWRKVAAAYVLEVVFDADFEPSRTIRLRIADAGFREALRILAAATGTFAVPVNEGMLLVAADTQQKRQEVEPYAAVVLPIPEPVSVQEAQEAARAVQQLLDIRRLVVDTTRRLVLLRDRASTVRAAAAITRQLMNSPPEVTVEVEFLEVTDSSRTRYGLDLPGSFPLVWLSNLWGNKISIPEGTLNLAVFGGGATLFGVGIADAELFASMTHSSGRSLLRSTLRTLHGQPATLHVGDRYPVQTQGYFGPVEGQGKVYTPPPAINFEDLGVVVKVTPYVHGGGDVTLEVESEFKVLAGEVSNGIPVIANRSFKGVCRLKGDEWAVMAGLMKTSEARQIAGLWGLARIPYLGALFRQDTTEKESSQTLLVLRPRIVRLPPGEALARAVWTGTETRPSPTL
jgi:hypothetical protein